MYINFELLEVFRTYETCGDVVSQAHVYVRTFSVSAHIKRGTLTFYDTL